MGQQDFTPGPILRFSIWKYRIDSPYGPARVFAFIFLAKAVLHRLLYQAVQVKYMSSGVKPY